MHQLVYLVSNWETRNIQKTNNQWKNLFKDCQARLDANNESDFWFDKLDRKIHEFWDEITNTKHIQKEN
jgi:hypothetical protein